MQLEHVKGHSGDVGNDGADYQANRGCELPSRPDRDWEQLEADVRQRIGAATELRIREPSPELIVIEPATPSTSHYGGQVGGRLGDMSAEEIQVRALSSSGMPTSVSPFHVFLVYGRVPDG